MVQGGQEVRDEWRPCALGRVGEWRRRDNHYPNYRMTGLTQDKDGRLKIFEFVDSIKPCPFKATANWAFNEGKFQAQEVAGLKTHAGRCGLWDVAPRACGSSC